MTKAFSSNIAHTPPVVSIIIPAKNGQKTIGKVLQAIFEQEFKSVFEVIVIDSGSNDQTLEIVSNFPIKLVEIRPEEFSHSGTRNFGASLAGKSSEYLIFLNQDALPSDSFWLANLVRSITVEKDLKAVYAAELFPGDVFHNVSGVASYVFRTSATKGIHVIEPGVLDRYAYLPKVRQHELFPFSTVCAIFDKEHFLRFPFNEKALWGEDLHWAVDNSRNGYRSGCTTLACVFHYHDYSEAELREIAEHTKRLYQEVFGWTVPLDEQTSQFINCCRLYNREILDSMSWKVTAPLRWLHAKLISLLKR